MSTETEDLFLDRQRRMLGASVPLIMRTWRELRGAPARAFPSCASGDLVAHVVVGPAAQGGEVEVSLLDRALVRRWMREQGGLQGTAADQKLSRSAFEFMRQAPIDVSMSAVMPTRTEDAIWVVLEDGRQLAGIVCLSFPIAMAPGGEA